MTSPRESVGAGVMCLLTTSCTFYGSADAVQAPPRPTYEASGGPVRAIRIDASPGRAQAIENALTVTLAILGSEEFQAVLKAEHLRRDPKEKKPAAIGDEVAEFLSRGLPSSVTFLERKQGFWGFWGVGSTTATTDQPTAVVSLAPFRIDEWIDGRSGLLVNTLAHELTHLDRRYLDGDREYCHEATLVSYRVGDLVQCAYESKGDAAELKHCAETMSNGVPDRAERLASCQDAPD